MNVDQFLTFRSIRIVRISYHDTAGQEAAHMTVASIVLSCSFQGSRVELTWCWRYLGSDIDVPCSHVA